MSKKDLTCDICGVNHTFSNSVFSYSHQYPNINICETCLFQIKTLKENALIKNKRYMRSKDYFLEKLHSLNTEIRELIEEEIHASENSSTLVCRWCKKDINNGYKHCIRCKPFVIISKVLWVIVSWSFYIFVLIAYQRSNSSLGAIPAMLLFTFCFIIMRAGLSKIDGNKKYKNNPENSEEPALKTSEVNNKSPELIEKEKELSDINNTINEMQQMVRQAQRDLKTAVPESKVEDMYKNGFITNTHYEEIKNARESLNMIVEFTPISINEIMKRRNEIINKIQNLKTNNE